MQFEIFGKVLYDMTIIELLMLATGLSADAFAAALCDSGLSKEELEELRGLLERGKL